MRQPLDARFRALFLGDVLDHSKHVPGLALIPDDRNAGGGGDAALVVAQRDRMLVEKQRTAAVERGLVVAVDLLRHFQREYILRPLADHLAARNAIEILGAAVD